MICSYIYNNDYGFIEVHAEQVYTHISQSSLNSRYSKINNAYIEQDGGPIDYIGTSIYANKLTFSTLTKLISFINETKVLPSNVILDFNRILIIQKNLKDSFKTLTTILSKKRSKLLLMNFHVTDAEDYWDNYKIEIECNDGELTKIKELKQFLLEEKKNQKLINSFIPQNPPYIHESSSVYLNQYFDFKKFIYKDAFIYYCLYLLALKMNTKNDYHNWEIVSLQKNVIFCQTLNSSYIGSILADLLGLDMFLIDHLGPINKIYSNKLYGKIDEKGNYLVVSDVLCLGTEVKNSKSIIEFSGAKYLGNVAFLRIESRKEKDIDFNDIEFFYRITENYNPVGYEITTALNQPK